MPARKAAQGLKGHPMEQKIIEALMDGKTPREISAWVYPRVTHVTIWRYSMLVLKPVLTNAEALRPLLPESVIPTLLSDDENTEVKATSNSEKHEKQIPEEVKQIVKTAILGAPALHLREKRIEAAADRHRRMQMIVDERADEMGKCESCGLVKDDHPWEDNTNPDRRCDTFKAIPGGSSGLLTRDYKSAGEGVMLPVYKVDTGLLSEFREHEKQVATELGQWQENTASGQVSIQINCPWVGDKPPSVEIVDDNQLIIEGSAEEVEESAEIGLLQKPT